LKTLSNIGRVFYGISITIMGLLTVYYKDFPYMFIPDKHSWIPLVLTYISGALLILSGACIISAEYARPASLLLGSVLLAIFCFYFVPYQFLATTDYMQFGAWENAEKELTLAGRALIIAGCFAAKKESALFQVLSRLIPLGRICFALTIICFGIDHFLVLQDAAEYVPAWIPFRLFWAAFAGAALIGSGTAILFKIKPALFAGLLGTMIFMWFLILHLPRVIVSPAEYMASEIASAFLALAYSGTAYVIAGTAKKQ
jgi:uncharacterized membrane protein